MLYISYSVEVLVSYVHMYVIIVFSLTMFSVYRHLDICFPLLIITIFKMIFCKKI